MTPEKPSPSGRGLGEGAHPTQETTRLNAAQKKLDHTFTRPELLEEALTHRSAAHGRRTPRRGERRGVGSNERLEFIGDRVLGLLVAEWLIERFPDEQEGELGPRHAQLVSRPVLAAIGEAAEFAALLALAPNEARAGVAHLSNTLADAIEALIGALYLDAGLDAARRFVRTSWSQAMERQLLPPKDPKTRLQEWLMARSLPLPDYTVSERTGPSHAPAFVITVTGGGQVGQGTGGSKREAERIAAEALLLKLAPSPPGRGRG